MPTLILQTEQQTPNARFTGSTCTLRIYASTSFYTAEGEQITGGQVGSHNWYQSYTCSIDGDGLITIPQVSLGTTTDSTVPNAVYTAVFYDAAGHKKNTKLSNFAVDPEAFQVPPQSSVEVTVAGTVAARGIYTYRGQNAGKPYYNLDTYSDSISNRAIVWDTTDWNIRGSAGNVLYTSSEDVDYPWEVVTWIQVDGSAPVPDVAEYATVITSSWEQLILSSQGFGIVPNPTYPGPFWNVPQTKEYVNSLVGDGTTPFSNSLVCGKTFLSADPVLPQVPIAVGQNDPYWQFILNRKVLSIDYGNDLATAIADIGSTPTELLITETSNSVTTNETTPATLLLTFVDTGELSVGGGHTVTIGLMSPAPSKQLFTGAGSVYLAKNAVEEKDLSWWAGNSSTADLTTKFTQFLTNGGRCYVPPGVWKCTNVTIPSYTILRGGGGSGDATNGTVIQLYDLVTATCVLKANEAFRFITVKDLTISTSSSTASNGFIAQGTAPNTATYLYLENVAFYGTGSGAPAQFYLKDIGGGQWQLEECLLNHCTWVTPASGISYKCESVNTSVTITQGLFGGGAGYTAIEGTYIGFLTLIQCQAAGVGLSALPYNTTLNRTIKGSITSGTKDLTITTGSVTLNDLGRPVAIVGKLDSYIDAITSATTCHVHDNATATATTDDVKVYEYAANPARGGTFIHKVNSSGCINLINCTDEGMNYFIKNDVSDQIGTINLTNCWPQSWIQFNQSCTINSTGCHYFSQTWRDAVGAQARINSTGDFVDDSCVQILTGNVQPVLLTPYMWGVRDGASFVQTQFQNLQNTYKQYIGLPTDFRFGNEWTSGPQITKQIVGIGSSIDTTGGPHKILQRLGRLDPTTEEFDYYYDTVRDFDTGFLVTEGNQTAPYAGWQYNNGPVVADIFVGNVVSPAAITTDGGTYYPLEYKQNVRMTANADHTIGGLVFPAIESDGITVIPAMAGTHAYLWNISAFNITFLHQSGGANANERFICDIALDIVCAPNEVVHVVRDNTTNRWRASKFNITGLYGDGDRVFVNAANGLFISTDLQVGGAGDIGTSLVINGGAALLTSDQTGTGNIVMDASPTLTGTPLAPTAAVNTNSTQIATTAYVGIQRSYLSSTQTYNNTAALANTPLSVTLTASGTYKIELTVFSTSAVKGLNMDFAGTSSQTNFIGQWIAHNATTLATMGAAQVTAAGTDFGPATMDAVAASTYTFNGTVEVNAGGTFLLRGAQNAADASNTTILRGSSLVATRLA